MGDTETTQAHGPAANQLGVSTMSLLEKYLTFMYGNG